jgi:hypothetical protein
MSPPTTLPNQSQQPIHDNKNTMNNSNLLHQRTQHQQVEPATFSVKVVFEKRVVEYFDSLVDLWSEWYRPYFLQATRNTSSSSLSYPVLMIRHEDLLLHGSKIVKMIAQCMGKEVSQRPYRYQTDTAKSHGSGTNLVKAVLQAGDATRRYRGGVGVGNDNKDNSSNINNMTRDDLIYSYSHLNHDIMKAFHYKFIVPPS